MADKKLIVVVQCDIVMDRCSGYFCEKSFNDRSGAFADYPAEIPYRTLHMTCGGCCGRAVHRKLGDLIHTIKKKEGIGQSEIVVHLASCVVKDNFHAPPCPHLDYLKSLITGKRGLDLVEGTHFSEPAVRKRKTGHYST